MLMKILIVSSFCSSTTPYSTRAAFRFLKRSIANDGILSLYRGNSATMVRIIPYSGIQFGSHEQFKKWLHVDKDGRYDFDTHAISMPALIVSTLFDVFIKQFKRTTFSGWIIGRYHISNIHVSTRSGKGSISSYR